MSVKSAKRMFFFFCNKENYAQMQKLVAHLNSVSNHVVSGGKAGEKLRKKHTSKGKLLARDRIKYLIDPK
jgi:3-methylcrotonyl-CoA carboxylase beta subunit